MGSCQGRVVMARDFMGQDVMGDVVGQDVMGTDVMARYPAARYQVRHVMSQISWGEMSWVRRDDEVSGIQCIATYEYMCHLTKETKNEMFLFQSKK